MLQKMITFMPELILLLNIVFMILAQKYRETATPKTFSSISRYFILASLFFTIILYNRSGFPQHYENSLYTSLFKTMVYVLALVWFGLSVKWFLNEDRSSLRFYALTTGSLIAISLMISSLNFALLFVAWSGIWILNYFLIRRNYEDEEMPPIARNYLLISLFFSFLFVFACALLYYRCGSLAYGNVQLWLAQNGGDGWYGLLAVGLLLSVLLFSFGMAPFHFWYPDVIKVSILPVAGWLTLVPIFAYFACFADLVVNVFWSVYPQFQPAMIIFALLSLFVGAIGANGEHDLRRLFAHSTLFHLGFILISILSFSANSIFSSFVYLLVYVLAMTGIYASFLGLKSKGIYLKNLSDLAGLSKNKPYIAAAILLFMVSLIGSPPMLGFLGKLSVINNLVLEQNYLLVGAVLVSLILIANAYLRVVKYMYFDKQIFNFDRSDRGIYIFLFVNLLIVIISILHPRFLMNDFEKMLITVF